MEYYREHRAEYPLAGFETRALPPVDGTHRLLTMANWYWEKLDECIQHKYLDFERVTAFCLECTALKVAENPEKNFDKVLYDNFMCHIFCGYYHYIQCRDNIANDFWPPH